MQFWGHEARAAATEWTCASLAERGVADVLRSTEPLGGGVPSVTWALTSAAFDLSFRAGDLGSDLARVSYSMPRTLILAAVAATTFVSQMMTTARSADGKLSAMPTIAASASPHLKLDRLTLAPMAHTMFCVRYQDECRVRPLFRGGPVHLTETRWADLKEANQSVNRAIIPEAIEPGPSVEAWLIDPERGDCNDYAVSKRHKLLQRGWPPRALLLGEVVTASGQHHLVLVVRTKSGDLVLDNLTPQIRPWSRAPYRWVRVQSPSNPRYWRAVAQRGE